MSGFAGMVSLDGAAPNVSLLQSQAKLLAFRGPDATHIWTRPGAGFCFTFLRTGPAPQSETQPCTLDGSVWLLGDVRLDGRDDLRRELEQFGESIEASATDEELVLRVWRRWGEAGLAKLLGDFSFALWDVQGRQLWCLRDLAGSRPFFYAQTGSWLYFSNTLQSIRCSPEIPGALDDCFVSDFLLQAWCPDLRRTAFRDISRLPPGKLLRYSNDGLHVRRLISVPIEEPLWLKREEEYVDQFRGMLEQAVRDRLPHGRTAIFMSGGLDSTSVAASAVETARKNGAPVAARAHTVDCQPEFDDQEGRLASLTAQHLGIPIEIQAGASCLPYERWSEVLKHLPEPLHDPYRSLYLEQVGGIARHARVALNGYGGDGIMTGQAWPYLMYLVRQARLGKMASAFGGYVLSRRRFPPLRGGFRSRIRKYLKLDSGRNACPSWFVTPRERKLRRREQQRDLKELRVTPHYWYPRAYEELNNGSWASVLESEDSSWTGVPVESRAPLLDLRIQKFLLRVPPVPLCMDKELLRRAVSGRLPEEVRLRPKTSFDGDLLAQQVAQHRWSPLPLLQPSPALRGFVDWEALRATLDRSGSAPSWMDLTPISLDHWLKGVENGQSLRLHWGGGVE